MHRLFCFLREVLKRGRRSDPKAGLVQPAAQVLGDDRGQRFERHADVALGDRGSLGRLFFYDVDHPRATVFVEVRQLRSIGWCGSFRGCH